MVGSTVAGIEGLLCNLAKSISEFHVDRTSMYGALSASLECSNEYAVGGCIGLDGSSATCISDWYPLRRRGYRPAWL